MALLAIAKHCVAHAGERRRLVGAVFPAAAPARQPPRRHLRDHDVSAQRDALHERHAVGPAVDFNPLDPDYATGTFGLLYETAVPVRPADRQVHPLARARAAPGRAPRTTPSSSARGSPGPTASRSRPTTSSSPSTSASSASVPYSTLWNFLTERHETVDALTVKFTFSRRVPGVGELAVQPADRAASTSGRPRPTRTILKGNNANAVGTGPYALLTYDPGPVVWVKNDAWWGKTAPRPRRQAQVHRRHRQRQQQRRARPADAGRHRPEQQLPARHRQLVDRRLRHPDLLSEAAPYMLSANTAWLVDERRQEAA